ncbi:MAG: glycosyltransferase family 4 protein [Bdellovibrionales bacterium]
MMPPNRQPIVLQLIPELETGGAERGCVDMAAAIQAAGGRALVVSAGGKMVPEIEAAGAAHFVWPQIKSKNPFKIFASAWKLKALIRAENVQVIHARSRAPAWAGWLAARWTGRPFMTTFHSTYNFKSAPKRFYNSVMTRGRRVIAISDFIRQHVLKHYSNVDAKDVRLIHRGIDVAKFDPAAVSADRVAALKAKWGVPADKQIILLPGRLTRWKGQLVLIKAIAQLAPDRCVAVMVGSDQGRDGYRESLEQQVIKRRIQARVFMPGDCSDMPAAYAAADIVVSASIEPEAFGRVIVEAQAMGKPVVVSDLGAVAETAGATGFGWIVPPGDDEALAAAVRQIWALPPEEHARRAAAARQYILQHYTKEKMCADTLAVYRELI